MPQMITSTPRRRQPAPIFSLPVLIILFPIFALLLLFLVVPPFLSVTTQILSPLCVRKSWDTLNIFLVLLAIISGVLERKNDGDETNNNSANAIRNDSIGDSSKASGHHVSKQWFEHPERKTYDGSAPINVRSPASSVRRLKRSSSSYPDMRQDSLWVNNEDRFRFFDDFEINKYQSSSSYDDQVHELHRTLRSGFEESEAKVIPVDTFVLRSSPLSTPPAPPHAARHKPRRTYLAAGQEYHKVMNQNQRVEINEIKSPSVIPPPPPPRRPPSPLIQVRNRSEQKHEKLERRKSTATKEIRMVFASLRKRKKKQKSKDRGHQQDCPLQSSNDSPPNNSITIRPTSPAPPPPPPPPPPSSVFQKYNLFRKGSKSKKFHYVPTPPPPPPPPPVFLFSKRSSKNTQITPPSKPPPAPSTPPSEPSRKRTTSNNSRPPLPTKANTTSYYDDNVNSGGQSPLIPMPPPPPPFKMPDFKLVIRGDFVKLRSSPSSWYSSPDMEEIDVSSSKAEAETVTSMMENDDGIGISGVSVYCPSPDVNAKAETFIARLRDGWKLENITP